MESHSPYSWQTVLCHSLIHWSALPETFIIRPLSAVQAVGAHQFLDGGQKTADMLLTTEEGPGCVCCSRPSLIHSNTYKNTLKKIQYKTRNFFIPWKRQMGVPLCQYELLFIQVGWISNSHTYSNKIFINILAASNRKSFIFFLWAV